MNKNTQVLLFFGGESSEHDVSILSARNVFAALDKDKFSVLLGFIDKTGHWWLLKGFDDHKDLSKAKQIFPELGEKSFITEDGQKIKPDIILPILHGENCEDGAIQGLAKLLHLPIVGCKIAASAICMDKTLAKQLLEYNGIKTSPFLIYQVGEELPNYVEVAKTLSPTLFIKPAGCGSSVGVAKAINEDEFKAAIKLASKYDCKVLIEKAIDAREIEVAVLGNGEQAKASHPGEIKPDNEFYDYEAKYADSSDSKVIIPADLPEEISDQIRFIALKAYNILGCEGLSRVDFLLSRDGEIYLNEINTLPGFTNISMYPKLWDNEGLSYSELLEKLIDLELS